MAPTVLILRSSDHSSTFSRVNLGRRPRAQSGRLYLDRLRALLSSRIDIGETLAPLDLDALTRGSFKTIPASEETTNTQRFEANSLADEPVSGEPVCEENSSPTSTRPS